MTRECPSISWTLRVERPVKNHAAVLDGEHGEFDVADLFEQFGPLFRLGVEVVHEASRLAKKVLMQRVGSCAPPLKIYLCSNQKVHKMPFIRNRMSVGFLFIACFLGSKNICAQGSTTGFIDSGFVLFVLPYFGLGTPYLWTFFGKGNPVFHDRMSNTRVIQLPAALVFGSIRSGFSSQPDSIDSPV